MQALFDLLAPLIGMASAEAGAAFAVFARVSGMVFFLPGIGEQTVPVRVRLAAAAAIAIVVIPAVRPPMAPDLGIALFGQVVFAEAVIGLALGISFRIMIFALQLAGAIIAQNASISQLFGQNLANDTETPIANVLTFAGIALALSFGLHFEAVGLFIQSYEVFAFGQLDFVEDIALWVAESGGAAFALAFSLAAPFVALGLGYNMIIGAANRAMPQLMVAFVGAPAITGAGLLLLAVSAPFILQQWYQSWDQQFRMILPFGT